jgi:hypothetical protein
MESVQPKTCLGWIQVKAVGPAVEDDLEEVAVVEAVAEEDKINVENTTIW